MPPLPPDAFELEAVGRPWDLPEGAPLGFEASDYYLGQGQNALEVAVAVSSSPPNRSALRTLWSKRHAGRPSPVLCVALYQRSGTWRAAVCGPTGKDPTAVLDLDLGHVRRICEAALGEPDRHAATRFLMEALPESSEELPGLRNVGMFATHQLRSGVPDRNDWEAECETGRKLLYRAGRQLVEGLGFEVEDRGPTTSVLRAEGTARAVAVFLDESESAEGTYQRFGGTSPATHGLAAADRDGLPYVLLTRGRQVRLYATDKSAGVGRKGRAETFVEANLALLPDDSAGYLPLIFGADALASEGSFEQILERSRDFATDLGARLRDRVYNDVVPGLARAVIAGEEGAGEDDLERLYEETLVILFRLLFIAYAEDRELLPYRASGTYQRHALKTHARELADRWNEDRLEFDPHASDLWSGAKQLFEAVNVGNTEWQVPEYDGGLFSSDPEVSQIGSAIDALELTNADFGPPLAALLVDRGDDGIYGPVDFRSLSVREFGTIYEGLLESNLARATGDLTLGRDGTYLPAKDGEEVAVSSGQIYLHDRSGARKATGSYFTKPFAVEHLLNMALEPALDDHLKRVQGLLDEGEQAKAADAFFDFRCADIAMGSGHFLVAAIDHIEARLSSLLAEQPIPEVTAELERLRTRANESLDELAAGVEIEQSSLLRRQVARRCIYGADRNPVAVELARLALWIHTFVPGLPLGLLDRNLVCGDSLTGIGTVDEAASVLRGGEGSGESLFVERIDALLARAEDALRRFGRASDADAREISKARDAALEASEAVQPVQDLFDLLVAVRLDRADRLEEMTEEAIVRHPGLDEARALSRDLRALHFPVAFPEVFLRGRPGFDCMVGNPPWEKVHVEEHGFWALRFPGLRSLSVARMNEQMATLRQERPDLLEEFEAEVHRTSSMRDALLHGPYPDLGRGHPDLYKAFAWRFWGLCRENGAIGVVLPRSALSAAGSAEWRGEVLDMGEYSDVTLLLNNRQWVFDDVHPQWTVALVAIRKGLVHAGTVRMRGPFRDMGQFVAGTANGEVAEFPAAQLRSWMTGAAFPLLPSARSAGVFTKFRRHPRLDSAEQPWRARPVQGDLNATTGKKHMELRPGSTDGLWPVYKGASFNLWTPDTGEYYAWVDPEHIVGVLEEKRQRGGARSRSAFADMPESWVKDPTTLPCLRPRIAYRRVTNRTNQRTLIAALVPQRVVLTDKASFLLWPKGDAQDEAFLLGILSSIPLDWYARRVVEIQVDFHVLNGFPIPRRTASPIHERIVRIAGALAFGDPRFVDWAAQVGVDEPAAIEQRADHIAELDASVSHLYGLDPDDIKHVFETFHEGWDPSERLERVLEHYEDLKVLA